jgi:WhiB family redox-sensing transcriptional regulator
MSDMSERKQSIDMNDATSSEQGDKMLPVRSRVVYIPTGARIDRAPLLIDEVELKGYCVTINDLKPPVLQERMRQLIQYFPESTKDTWIRVVADWLDGRGVGELAKEYGFDESAVGVQLMRASKIILKERSSIPTRTTLTSDDLEWQASALCAQVDADPFFPDRGETSLPAKKVCAACEVKKECDAYGVDEPYGIWAEKASSTRRRAAKGDTRSA